MPKHIPLNLEAHSGEDYTVVMLPDEATDTASIRIYGEHAKELSALIAAAPELLEALVALHKVALDLHAYCPDPTDSFESKLRDNLDDMLVRAADSIAKAQGR